MVNAGCPVDNLHAAVPIHVSRGDRVVPLPRQFPIDRVTACKGMRNVVKWISHWDISAVHLPLFPEFPLEKVVCGKTGPGVIAAAYDQIRPYPVQIGYSG